MEVPAEAALVGQAGDPHHHPVAVLPIGEEGQRRRFAAELVLGACDGHWEQAFRRRFPI